MFLNGFINPKKVKESRNFEIFKSLIHKSNVLIRFLIGNILLIYYFFRKFLEIFDLDEIENRLFKSFNKANSKYQDLVRFQSMF